MNYEQAMSKLATVPHQDLLGRCREGFRDFYGHKGYHMSTYTKLELITWFDQHYMWDNDEQFWRNQVPFHNEDEPFFNPNYEAQYV